MAFATLKITPNLESLGSSRYFSGPCAATGRECERAGGSGGAAGRFPCRLGNGTITEETKGRIEGYSLGCRSSGRRSPKTRGRRTHGFPSGQANKRQER